MSESAAGSGSGLYSVVVNAWLSENKKGWGKCSDSATLNSLSVGFIAMRRSMIFFQGEPRPEGQ